MKLTCLYLSLMIVTYGLLSQDVLAQTSKDKADVAAITDSVTLDFVHKDMKHFSKLWADDAVFITVTGLKADGRDAIVDMHSMAPYIIDDSTQIKLNPPVIGFPDKNLAIVYSVWAGLVFKVGESKTPVQSGYLTVVLRKKNGSWKIVSATNAYNFEGRHPFNFETYTPDTWREWGLQRPAGLPLSKSAVDGS